MSFAEKFFFSWCKKTNSRAKEMKSLWGQSKAYTKLIIHSDNSILMDISTDIDLKCYNADYYYIDSVFFKPEDLVPKYPEAYYLTDIRIAFEHENDFTSGLFQEVCHLLQVNCDLKVLVTYPQNEEEEAKELGYLHSIINKSRSEKELSDQESFLIIMGHGNLSYWKAWVYKTQHWEQMTNKPIKRD